MFCISSVQSLSCVCLFVTPWTAACQAAVSITNSWSLFKLMSIESVMPSSHFILCRPLLLLPSIVPSIGVFSNECQPFSSGGQSIGASALASVLQMHIQDWFPFGWTGWICLWSKGLSRVFSNTTVQKYQFFSAQHYGPVPQLYMTTGKTTVSTIRTFVSKVISLLFNMLFRLVIAFLPRSKHVLISWLHSPAPLILEPPKIVCHCFHCFPIYLPWSDETRCHDLRFLNVEL